MTAEIVLLEATLIVPVEEKPFGPLIMYPTLVSVTPPWTTAMLTEPRPALFAVAVIGELSPQPPRRNAAADRTARTGTLRIDWNKGRLQVVGD